jgi:hypothetical protein
LEKLPPPHTYLQWQILKKNQNKPTIPVEPMLTLMQQINTKNPYGYDDLNSEPASTFVQEKTPYNQSPSLTETPTNTDATVRLGIAARR